MTLELTLDHGVGMRQGAPPALEIALVNNMPDAALEDTERQFCTLLRAAAAARSVRLTLVQLPGVPRSLAAQSTLASRYVGLEALFARRFDGVIVTGTEPCQPDLKREPYWPALAEVFAWAARETGAAIYSCLAAHAAVLHVDGIPRYPLAAKLCGVFSTAAAPDHRMMAGVVPEFPHSRWNEVRSADLTANGYAILAHSRRAGAGIFAREREGFLALHFQGHPEYEAETLFKEYRRDVRRFLLGERETYPGLPYAYFDSAMRAELRSFQRAALARREPELLAQFPDLAGALVRRWARPAARIYRNWLDRLQQRRRPPRAIAPPPPRAQARRPLTAAPLHP